MPHILTTCTFCGAGCGIYLETARDDRIVGSYPSMSHPANEGRICARGWHVHEVASSPDRLRRPLLRKGSDLVEVGYEEAIQFIAERLRRIRERHGPDAIFLASSPRCSNEEVYLLQKLARAVIGTHNVDHGAGVYGNNATDVLLDMIGVPATTGSMRDLSASDAILVDGLDLGRQLPTVGGRVIRAKLAGAKLLAIGERRHRVAEHADVFLQLRPGTEALLYGAMAKVIVDRGLVDRAFVASRCSGYERFLETIRDYDLLAAAQACGVDAGQVEAAAVAFGQARAATILFSTADETRTPEALRAMVNLALLTGNLGKEGAGIFALTEHNNLLGACDMGGSPRYLPGYRRVESDEARAEVERAWGVRLPAAPGLPASTVLRDRGGGRVRAMWLCRYDPVATALVEDAAPSLAECDLVVVQHLFATPTARYAHVVLPTTAFGEETVTFTSTDRRIQLARAAIAPPPGVRPAWRHIADVARALGAAWPYASSADVMDEIAALVPQYGGVSYPNLEREGRHWPCTRDRPLGTPLLFADGDADRRFVLAAVPRQVEPRPDPPYPFALVFGRSNYYWNQSSLVQHSEVLKREYRALALDYPDGFVELNPADAKELGIRDGEWIRVHAAGGSALTAARVTGEVRRGAVFVPYFVAYVEKQLRGSGEGARRPIPVRIEKEERP